MSTNLDKSPMALVKCYLNPKSYILFIMPEIVYCNGSYFQGYIQFYVSGVGRRGLPFSKTEIVSLLLPTASSCSVTCFFIYKSGDCSKVQLIEYFLLHSELSCARFGTVWQKMSMRGVTRGVRGDLTQDLNLCLNSLWRLTFIF